MLHMCVCMHSRFIKNYLIWILEDGLFISEVVLSQPFSTQTSPPLKHAPPDARQFANKVSGDNSHQYEIVRKSNSQDFDVPIPPGRHGRGGRGLRGDLQ
jgi:hypothetical protein